MSCLARPDKVGCLGLESFRKGKLSQVRELWVLGRCSLVPPAGFLSQML